MENAVLILGAYLVGSISSAILVCKLLGLPDPRTEGSRNPGATNVLRLGGKKAAAVTLAGDMLKGWLPILLAQLWGVPAGTLALVGLAAFLGHLYPVFFGFRGGKGVATAFGVLLGYSWASALAALATWLLIAKLFRYSSLAALAATLLTPLYMWLFKAPQETLYMMTLIGLLLIWRHRGNVLRLWTGTETRIGARKP